MNLENSTVESIELDGIDSKAQPVRWSCIAVVLTTGIGSGNVIEYSNFFNVWNFIFLTKRNNRIHLWKNFKFGLQWLALEVM